MAEYRLFALQTLCISQNSPERIQSDKPQLLDRDLMCKKRYIRLGKTVGRNTKRRLRSWHADAWPRPAFSTSAKSSFGRIAMLLVLLCAYVM